MTHAELVEVAARWLRGTRRCALVATERSCFKSLESPDAIGWTAVGRSVLVEVKVSVEDFRADQRKVHRQTGPGMGFERWYLAEPGVLDGVTMPEGWGLLVLRAGRVHRMVHASERVEAAGEIARLEQPLLVALTRRAIWGNPKGLTATDADLEVLEAANG